MRKFLIVLAMVAMASFLLVGCDTGTTPVTPVTTVEPELQLVGIAVEPETMDLFGVGDSDNIDSVTANYELKGYGVDVDFNDCLYLTSDSKVAKVEKVKDSDGVVTAVTVTAVAEGTADILVSYEGKMDTVKVTVKGLLEVVPHSNQNEDNKVAGHPYILWKIDGPCIEFEFVNPTSWLAVFDYRVDREAGEMGSFANIVITQGECEGQIIGEEYNLVVVTAGETKTVRVCVEEEVWVGMRQGGEELCYLDWIKFEVK